MGKAANKKLISKIFWVFFFISVFQTSFSQEISRKNNIYLEIKDKSLKEVLDTLQDITGVYFSYALKNYPSESSFELSVQNKTLDESLTELFKDTQIKYKWVEKEVVVKFPKPTKKEPKTQLYSIHGTLTDKKTGEAIIGANVYVKDSYHGTMSNGYGFYSLSLPKGKYKLIISYLGYRSKESEIELKSPEKIDVQLEEQLEVLEEIVIKHSESEPIVKRKIVQENILKPAEVTEIPSNFGEPDLIKSLQAVPGIKLYGDGSSIFYVRGGSRDQNRILIDEAPVYNPSHLLGFVSGLVPEVIQDLKIYKGDIPVQHGGALSSLIDIKTKEGNKNQFRAAGDLGMLTTRLSIEAPITVEKSSFYTSVRSSHLDWLYKKDNPDTEIHFYDFNLKTNLYINRKNRLFLSFYTGRDEFGDYKSENGNFGLTWGNFAGSIRWNHIFNDQLFSNTTLHTSSYYYVLHYSNKEDEYWQTSIGNLSLKTDFTWYPTPEQTMRFGYFFNAHNFNPGNLNLPEDYDGPIPQVPNENAGEFGVYWGVEQNWHNRFLINVGIRAYSWANYGPADVLVYNDVHTVTDTISYKKGEAYHKKMHVEPRVKLRYKLRNESFLQFNYAKTAQNIHLLSNSTGPFVSMDVWIPSGPEVKSQIAHQWSLAYKLSIPQRKLKASVEYFYKRMQNQIDYVPHAQMLLNPDLLGELRYGNAYAQGIEFMLKKEKSRVNGWLSYTYSRVKKQTPELNNGEFYYPAYDRPHDFNAFINYHISDRLKTTVNWMFMSGKRITAPVGFFDYGDYTVPYYDEIYNHRLPHYHRLDISMEYQLAKADKKFQHFIRASIYNVYNRFNPIAVNFNKTSNGSGYIIPSDKNGNPIIIPTEISLMGIMPSLSYHFRF
jgi:hypothetical protein